MSDDEPSEESGLQYRLAVAFCSAFVAAGTLLVLPLAWAAVGGAAEPVGLYVLVFSKWGVAAVLGAALLGFIFGGERMAEFFSFIWGTHPFWNGLGDWFEEHGTAGAVIAFAAIFLVIGFLWYSVR